MTLIDDYDRAIIRATQGGLPLVEQPYQAVADTVGLAAPEVMARIERMLAIGIIRRIGAVPNHYALGYTANGMTVWDVADDQVSEIGVRLAALDYVSHCYERPRHPPAWTYNLFAMVHARTRPEVEARRADMIALIGPACRGHDVLYSTRILKKTGMRLGK